jgi:hypothetical protein
MLSPLKTVGVLLILGFHLAAAEQSLTHLYPAAGQQGTTVAVTVSGKSEPWPPQVWVDAPGIVFKPGTAKGKLDVEIAKDATPGPHLVRTFNTAGASAPRFFIVSTEPEVLEKEPNDDFKSPQRIAALPATISGRLDKAGDVDSFAITLKKGDRLAASVEAYVLGSTFDGMLRVVDQRGTQFAFNHDGKTLDPLLKWTAPRDGTFVVQIMGFVYPATAAVGLTGGDGCVYRLHLSHDPAPSPQDSVVGAELAEQEPNDAASAAQPTTIPCTVRGGIDKPGDEDRFAFTAVKQRAYTFKVSAARDGSPLDAWLKITNRDGKELATNDDAEGSRDPQLTWTAPTDGTFVAALGEVTHHGGAEFSYRLTIAEAAPKVTATVANPSAIVAAGKSAELKVTVKRVNSFKAKVQLVAKNLPEGVTAPEIEVPEKGGDVTLKLTAAAETKQASGPFQLCLRESETGTEHPVRFMMTTTSENNGVPAGYTELVIDSTDQIWLTVTTASEKPVATK